MEIIPPMEELKTTLEWMLDWLPYREATEAARRLLMLGRLEYKYDLSPWGLRVVWFALPDTPIGLVSRGIKNDVCRAAFQLIEMSVVGFCIEWAETGMGHPSVRYVSKTCIDSCVSGIAQ